MRSLAWSVIQLLEKTPVRSAAIRFPENEIVNHRLKSKIIHPVREIILGYLRSKPAVNLILSVRIKMRQIVHGNSYRRILFINCI
jgi:hypothetical protein